MILTFSLLVQRNYFMQHLHCKLTANQPAGVSNITGSLNAPEGDPVDISFGDTLAVLEYTTDISLNLASVQCVTGATVEMSSVSALKIEIIKTAATTSGTVAITCATLGVSSTTVNMGSGVYLTASRGETVWSLAFATVDTKAVGTSPHVGLDFTSPVGFKVRVSVYGTLA